MWSAAEQGGMAIVSFVMLIVFARWLEPAEFGVFAVVLAVVEVLALLATTLFADALVQVKHLTRQHVNSAFALSLGIGTLLVLGVALSMSWFTATTSYPQAGLLLLAAAFSIPMAGVTSVLTALKRRDMDFRQLAARSIGARLAGAGAGAAVTVAGLGVWGLAAQHLVTAVLALALTWWLCRPGPRIELRRDPIVELLQLGAPVLGQALLAFVGTRLFIVVFGLLLGPEAAGYLTLAFRLVSTGLALMAGAINQVLLPALSALKERPAGMRARWLAVGTGAAMVVYPAFATLAAAAAALLPTLFGRGWEPATPIAIVMAISAMLQLTTTLAHNWFKAIAAGRQLMIAASADLGALIALTSACVLLLPSDQLTPMTAGVVYLARCTFSLLTALYLVAKCDGARPGTFLRAQLAPATLAVGCAALAWLAEYAMPSSTGAPARAAVGVGAALLLWLPMMLLALRRWRATNDSVAPITSAVAARSSAP